MRSNAGQNITIYNIPSLVNTAYVSALTLRNILAGFRSTGIFSCNRHVFPDEEFGLSVVTDCNTDDSERPPCNKPCPSISCQHPSPSCATHQHPCLATTLNCSPTTNLDYGGQSGDVIPICSSTKSYSQA